MQLIGVSVYCCQLPVYLAVTTCFLSFLGISGVFSRHTLPTLPPDPNGGCPYKERPAEDDAYCSYWCDIGGGRYAEGRYPDGLSCKYGETGQGECYGGLCQHLKAIRDYKKVVGPPGHVPKPEVSPPPASVPPPPASVPPPPASVPPSPASVPTPPASVPTPPASVPPPPEQESPSPVDQETHTSTPKDEEEQPPPQTRTATPPNAGSR
ncbi:hypothetical protein V5799_001488 [Amblyomma americanum]|uniref:Uncharacterized protein n=1 Tax=Amblyomma americanum TaxID=6943 RepID=A0AAQ4D018_AMBAM